MAIGWKCDYCSGYCACAGTDEALETLKQNDNTIWIGGTDIDITGETTDIEKKVSPKGCASLRM